MRVPNRGKQLIDLAGKLDFIGNYNRHHVGATADRPDRRAAKRSFGRMGQGYIDVGKDQNLTLDPTQIKVGLNTPEVDLLNGSSLEPYASNGIDANSGKYSIQANPQADEVYFAHELGHLISRQTPVGGAVRNVRDAIAANPRLAQALAATSVGAPLVMSAMEEGDDDFDTAVLAALATAAPTLVDETAASINAAGIMNKAGKRGMDARQTRRLAGGYASYVAPLIAMAATGNFIGNQFD